jgi:3-hydroxy-9,10-secoandrosta-1,3,5(10)-triene-9,17-dione monooxygenase
MRGSGSQSVKLTDVFVPDRHIVRSVLLTLPDWTKGTPGTALHGNPMYLGVPAGVYHATFTAILAGTAYAAADEYEEIMRRKSVMGNPNLLRMHDPASQAALGEARAKAHAAEAIAISVASEYMDQCRRWQKTGEPITTTDTFRLWATAKTGCYLACDAVEKLFRTASASSSHKGQRMQRYFRDIQMYLVHPSAQPIVDQFYAQNHLGLTVGLPGMS